jgi:hypothetical protein
MEDLKGRVAGNPLCRRLGVRKFTLEGRGTSSGEVSETWRLNIKCFARDS